MHYDFEFEETPVPFAQLWPEHRTLEALLREGKEDSAEGPVRALLAGAAILDRPNMYGDVWYVWVDPRTAREWGFRVASESPNRTPDVMYPLAVLNTIWPWDRDYLDEDVWPPEKIAALTADLFPTSSPEELQAEAELAHRMWRRGRWVMRALRGRPFGALLAPEIRSSYDEERAFPHFAHTPGCAVFWPLVLWLLEGGERLGEIADVCVEPLVRDLIETLGHLETGSRETLGKVALCAYREPLRQLLAETRAGREALRDVRALDLGRIGAPLAHGFTDLSRLERLDSVGAHDISPDIAHLKALEELVFTYSSFVSPRAELFQLPRLRRLHVVGRGTSALPIGPLPEALGNLEHLEELVLWHCGVTRVPGSIGELQALRWLVVSGGRLATLPPELARLGALEELSLAETQAPGNSEAMATVARLPRLRRLGLRGAEALAETLAGAQVESLDLSDAKLPLARALPVLEQLPRLRRLVLTGSPEVAFPEGFARLKLDTLVVGGARLDAESVVDALLEMPSLRTLSFSRDVEWRNETRLESVPERLGELQHLERLDLDLRYSRTRNFPRQLARLSRLRHLSLKRFDYVPGGGAVEVLRALSGLESLALSTTPPDRILWPALREMKGLRTLDLGWTELKTVPEWIGELSALEVLVLPETLARLPDGLAQLERLRVLTLNGQPSPRPIENPEVLGKLAALEELVIHGARLGRLPRFLEGAPRLRVLSLQGDDFSAEGVEGVVELATRLPSLRVLALDESLPLAPWRADDVRLLRRLSFLDTLSISQEEGSLPERLENLLRGTLPDTHVCSGWGQGPDYAPGLRHP